MALVRALLASLLLFAPALAFTQDCQRIDGLHPLLQQWHRGLEGWRGTGFLSLPTAKLDADCRERMRTLMQWKQALELWRRMPGRLDEPTVAVLGNCRRTMELLARWRYVIELWYGSPLLDAPDHRACLKPAAG